MKNKNKKLKLIVYPSETIVVDEKRKRVVACPTENEAIEYIREQKKLNFEKPSD